MCWFPTPQAPNKSFLEADILLIQKVKEKKEEDEDVKNFYL